VIDIVGPIAEQALEGLRLDVALIGVDGIDVAHGCTTHHEVEAHTNATLIARARHVIVVADSTKIGASAFVRICPIERVDELITDRSANVRGLRALREAGIEVSAV
jgi:DeoR family transcriptional regulator of aga operon